MYCKCYIFPWGRLTLVKGSEEAIVLRHEFIKPLI